MNWWDKIKYEFNKGDSPVRKLIAINVAVFVIGLLLGAFAYLYQASAQDVLVYLQMPSWAGEFIKRPWTIFTYMFLHAGFWHLAFNMYLLYVIGRIAEDFVPNERFYKIYFGGGIFGAAIFLIAYNTFPVFTQLPTWVPLLGASGAVVAIVIATATLLPNYELFLYGVIRIKLVWLAIIMVTMDIAFFPNGNAGGRIVHLGGALFGFLFIRYVQGRLGLAGINLDRIRRIFKPNYSVIDERNINRTPKKKRSKPNRSGAPNQSEIDSILDKINQSGYSSLSQEEKDKLFKASQ